MPKCIQLVMGAAGSGKTTYCKSLINHFVSIKRHVDYINIDPAVGDVVDGCLVCVVIG